MVDLSSLEAFHETLPTVPEGVIVPLQFKGYSKASRVRSAAALAKAGYLGCYPLGNDRAAKIVVRPMPGRSFADSHVGFTSTEIEGTTFSPDVTHWVGARMAMLKISIIAAPYEPESEPELVAYAEQFGGAEPARRVLRALAQLNNADSPTRIARLMNSVEPGDPFLTMLAQLWSTGGKERLDWLNQGTPVDPIAAGAQVATNLLYRTGHDLTHTALSVIRADALFDFSYTIGRLQSSGNWEEAPLNQAPGILATTALTSTDALLLEAAKAFAADPWRYDGSLHLTAARAIAASDPKLAYTQAINAGAFHARATKTQPRDAAEFASRLAREQGWADLSTLFDWTELGGP